MILLSKLIAISAIIYLIRIFYKLFFNPLNKKKKQLSRQMIISRKELEKKERLYHFKDIILRKITSKITLSELTRENYLRIIERLYLKTTPENIRSHQILYFLMGAIISIIVLNINLLLGYLTLLLPILGWMYPIDESEKKIQEKNKNIITEFPVFYSLLYYQYVRTYHIYLADVVRDYLPNASPDMAEELGIFIDNLEYGEVYALKQFKKRIPLRYIIKFCDIMQIRLNGYDNTAQMEYFKNELHDVRLHQLEEDLTERKNKNVRAQFALVLVLAVYVIFYFYYQFIDAVQLFG